ncbi:MAG: zf-TFIIB domain-containing protein [Chthonomonas sp.]|nr:zf-TFIIB domain-containing protein [Chthonomonas sp.]
MNCPNCNTPLHIAERLGVEIDFCQTCRGVWLDRGELDKIIQKSAQNDPSQPGFIPQTIPPAPRIEPARYKEPERYRDRDDDDDDDRYRKKKKRGDFLSDLFDF